ncbi:MAG: hypothetical protein GX079_06040 [Tissierellia bacterium]|nr:hypothetical protein [Tissierellia bacterium]
MKRKLLIGLLVLTLIVASACSNRAEEPEATDEIEQSEAESELEELPSHDEYVAEVDGRGISKEDFEKNVLFREYSYIMNYGEDIFEGDNASSLKNSIRYQVQEELAKELIYIILAEAQGYELDLEEAKTIYEDEFLERNTDQTLKYFADNNLDADFVINRIAIDQQVGSYIEALQEDYMQSDGFSEKIQLVELVRASHILLETKEEAEEVLKLIEEEPSRFEMLALERSTCPSAQVEGDLGYFEYSDMVEEFSKAAFDLEVDEVSPIVESSFGFHIIKLTDKGNLLDLKNKETEDESLEEKLLQLSYQTLGEKINMLFERQVEETPITYYNLDM